MNRTSRARRTPTRIAAAAVAAAAGVGAVVTGPSAPALAADRLPSHSSWLRDVREAVDPAADRLANRLTAAGRGTALVLDIDNTSLETEYSDGDSSSIPATAPVLALARQVKAAGGAVFFVTARPDSMRSRSLRNLEAVGYPVDGLYTRSGKGSVQSSKTAARIDIEELGYTIVANVGNNTHDLAGGHAEFTVKLPDYEGRLS